MVTMVMVNIQTLIMLYNFYVLFHV
jgi:hypothetical protein